jgi:hypothetical protein
MNADSTMTDTLPVWKKRKEIARGSLRIADPKAGTSLTQVGNTRTLVDPTLPKPITSNLAPITRTDPATADQINPRAAQAMRGFQEKNPGVKPIGIDLGRGDFAIGGGNTLRQNPATFDLDTPEHRAAAQARDAEFQARVRTNQAAYGMRNPGTAPANATPDELRAHEDRTMQYNTAKAQQGPNSIQQRDIRAMKANLPIMDARMEARRAQTQIAANEARYVRPAEVRAEGEENVAGLNADARTGSATIRAEGAENVAGITTGSHERIAAAINKLGYAKLSSEEKQNALKMDNHTMGIMLQQMGADDRARIIADGVKVGRFKYDEATGVTQDSATGDIIHEAKPAEKPGFVSRLFGGTGTPATPASITRPGLNVTQAAPVEFGEAQPTPLGNAVSGKKVDAQTAMAFLKQAGGDKNKARQLAVAAGYSF